MRGFEIKFGKKNTYHTRAIISRGLYIFTLSFNAVYIVEWLILQTIYVLKTENFQFLNLIPRFRIKSSFKSIAGYNGTRWVYKKLQF